MARKGTVITTFLPYAATEEQTPAFRLFFKKHKVRVAKIHTESIAYLNSRGVEGNEFGASGEANARQLITCMMAPCTMAEMVGEGATIALVDPDEAAGIYQDIKEHLQGWVSYNTNRLHGREVPLEDLRLFDQLASLIYPYARYDIQKSKSDLLLAGTGVHPQGGLRRGGFSRYSAEQRLEREKAERGSATTPLEHNPLIDAIQSAPPVILRKSKWA